ncbi:MAG: Indole-3-glycerol phosphate synthase [Firmicutes bacterium ADurb.Bin354]|nr:MAG: Indole-3-glycerol phosphate synthase [Firmicutes bacterium ADurb.Bin354]
MSKNILEEIAAYTKKRINIQKEAHSVKEVLEAAEAALEEREKSGRIGVKAFEEALKKEKLSFICEVKKASPSKGQMVSDSDFDPLRIASDYRAAGADAFSVLTEPEYFKGKDEYLKSITDNITDIPALRKDFTVDEYMIYEAETLGASAILLIVAILSQEELEKYLTVAKKLKLAAIVETHSAEEIDRALSAGADIVGINNRDLRTFKTDIQNSIDLRHLIPSDKIFISESGIHTPDDIIRLRECGADAVLIGEAMVTSNDKGAMLKALRG